MFRPSPCLWTGFRIVTACSHSASLLTRLCPVGSVLTRTQNLHSCRSRTPVCAFRNSPATTKPVSHLYLDLSRASTSRNSQTRTLPALLPRKVCQQLRKDRQRNLHLPSLGQLRPLYYTQLWRRYHVYCGNGVRPVFSQLSQRYMSTMKGGQQRAWQQRNKSVMLYVIAGAILVVGFSYAAVPLYTVFCQATGLGGQATAGHDTEKVETMAAVPERELTIRFNADTAASMRWNFRPQQTEVKVVPGETALAFYSAMNPTDKPIVGISTYNVVPFDAGQYFNKIQCFCFEEQRLNPHEQVDMPVFFYIDPDFVDDPKMEKVHSITLSYTFFESKEGLELPDPMSR